MGAEATVVEVREFTVMIGTAQPEALARFYGDVLGLERVGRFRDPVFRAGAGFIRVLDHSQIRGRNPQPARMQINLFVDDARAEVERVRAQGVRVVREPEREFWGGVVATLEDPDGNYVQLIQQATTGAG